MYLRQSNKWKEFALQEGVEDIGLPSEVAHYLRQQNAEHGPVENKHLTWIGNLLKAFKSRNIYNPGTHQTIVEDIIGRGGWPDTPEGEEAWANAVGFVNQWYIDNSEHRGLPTLADLKAFKKRGRKMLKKSGATDVMLRQWDSYLDNRVMRAAGSLKAYFVPIMQVLAEDPAFYDELRAEVAKDTEQEPHRALRAASNIAREILESPAKAEEQVIHTFDNGYFWYDIRSYACDFEGKKMGHCGRGDRGQLYSLRSGEKRREIKPMVTLEMDEDGTVYQIKGKANKAPAQDLWPYIDWFIENADVKRILETGMHSSDGVGFAEMREYLKQKHPEVKLEDSWVDEATETIEQFAPGMESDSQTFQEVGWPSLGAEEASFLVRHQAFWPVKDVIVDEETYRLRWEIRQDAQNIADDTLYPNPRVGSVDVFARGVQDSQAAMIRVELLWDETFEPRDLDDEEDVQGELMRLRNFLDEMSEISAYLVSPNAAPEEAEFDYNGFWERIQKRLEEYGVYRDVAGEIDAADERDREAQLGLPGIDAPRAMTPEEKAEEEHYLDQIYATTVPAVRREYQRRLDALRRSLELPLQEQRIIQRWSKIIK